ncbi:hypothetical protein K502DRAFT_333184 [Neoconidiobolus thromboides FSU 785]|nr:hypothetical protein K502DRAFT_333184 [Neoconidiobolus thromboides FSU 785]
MENTIIAQPNNNPKAIAPTLSKPIKKVKPRIENIMTILPKLNFEKSVLMLNELVNRVYELHSQNQSKYKSNILALVAGLFSRNQLNTLGFEFSNGQYTSAIKIQKEKRYSTSISSTNVIKKKKKGVKILDKKVLEYMIKQSELNLKKKCSWNGEKVPCYFLLKPKSRIYLELKQKGLIDISRAYFYHLIPKYFKTSTELLMKKSRVMSKNFTQSHSQSTVINNDNNNNDFNNNTNINKSMTTFLPNLSQLPLSLPPQSISNKPMYYPESTTISAYKQYTTFGFNSSSNRLPPSNTISSSSSANNKYFNAVGFNSLSLPSLNSIPLPISNANSYFLSGDNSNNQYHQFSIEEAGNSNELQLPPPLAINQGLNFNMNLNLRQ